MRLNFERGHGIRNSQQNSAQSQNRLAAMDLVIAAPRFHKDIPAGPEIIDWPSPFSSIYSILKSNSKKSVALLTTGDPMWYGAGASLVRDGDVRVGGGSALVVHACELIADVVT